MNESAQLLREIIETVEPELRRLNEDEVEIKPAPDEWSKKEILGHLIDSAANNHQRFVRAVHDGAALFPTYNQVKWVEAQHCNTRPWTSLIVLWVAYNDHLAHIMERLPIEADSAPCNIGEPEPAPLGFVVKDYLRHLRLHLKDLLGKEI